MNNKVDSLFKKLEEHSLSPSAGAWEKVEANLSKKNNTIAWVRVAAAVATVALLAFVVLLWTRTEDVKPSQLVKESKQKPAVEEKKMPEQQENSQPAVAEQKPSQQTKKQYQRKIQTEEKRIAEEIKKEVIQQEAVAVVETTQQQKVAVVEQKATPKKEAITLVFNLPTIKPSTPVEETIASTAGTVATAQDEEKRTTFQKAVDAANDLRSGDVLGNLREAKNELFALDFKKDKTKKHN